MLTALDFTATFLLIPENACFQHYCQTIKLILKHNYLNIKIPSLSLTCLSSIEDTEQCKHVGLDGLGRWS